MTENALPLEVVYAGWDNFQKRLVQVTSGFSAEELALPVSPNHWPIGMLIQHIISDRIWWFHLWMNEGGPEISSFMHWEEEEEGKSVHPAEELVAGLQASWEMIAATLSRYTVADLGQIFPPPPSLSERERQLFGENTRQEIIFHVLRHDLHHGGELAVGMGTHGMPIFWG
jgi:uncharacterized damage-inducible protein DinB